MSNLSKINEMIQDIIKFLREDPVLGNEGTSPLGSKMYSFGVLSDIHLRWGTGGPGTSNYNFKNGIDDFNRAIPALQNLGVDFVCITGDVGYDSSVKELELYKTAIDTYANVDFYATTGNHDWSHDDTTWTNYIGHPRNYEFVHDGDVFLFMGVNQSSSSAELANPYGSHLTWLKDRLTHYQGARIFIFMHYPLPGYAGLRDGTHYGFSSSSTEDDALLSAALAAKNVVIFSGHTHYKFDCEATYDSINVVNFNHNKVSLVHVPSSAYPRNASHDEEADLSEGYVVEVYEKGVIMRGVNLVTGKYMPDYEYALTTDNNQVTANTATINLSTTEISLISNESKDVDVTLSSPVNATVTITESNYHISVSPTSLTFTEDNYNIPQKVTITAVDIPVDGFATISVDSDGMQTKLISVSLTGNAVEEPGPTLPPEFVSGTWLFNDEITYFMTNGAGIGATYLEGFTSNNEIFERIGTAPSGFTNSGYDEIIYSKIPEENTTVYKSTTGWVSDSYRTVTFNEIWTVDEAFYDWLTANAVEVTPMPAKPATTSECNVENGAVYGGTWGSYTTAYQLTDGKIAGSYEFGLRDLNLKSSNTALYFSAEGSDTKRTSVDITLEGVNTIDTSKAYDNNSNTSQRGMSSSSKYGNFLTGKGDNAELIIKSDPRSKTETVKGNWIIENAKVTVTGPTGEAYDLVEVVTPSTIEGSAPAGITIRRSGEFSINGRKVRLVVSVAGGYLDVTLGAAVAGDTITISSHPENGYELTDILVNGVSSGTNVTVYMPSYTEYPDGIEIQGRFVHFGGGSN